MRVVGYSRVSSEEQAKAGISLAAQEAKLEAYALVKDWRLVEVIQDAAVSAKDLKRPGMTRLLTLVEARQVEVVMVYKLDRLTRSVVDLGQLMARFERRGVSLVSLQESLDATTATGELMMNLLASVSQWERKVIGERTRDALQYLKTQGRRYCRPRFGPAPGDGATLARIQTMRAGGATLQVIAEALTTAGIPTVRGGRWAPATVLGILRRHGRPIQEEVA